MYFTRENFKEDKFKNWWSSLDEKIFIFSFFTWKNREKKVKITLNIFKNCIWDKKKFLNTNPRIVQKKIILKFFYLKKTYKKIGKNICNMNP